MVALNNLSYVTVLLWGINVFQCHLKESRLIERVIKRNVFFLIILMLTTADYKLNLSFLKNENLVIRFYIKINII